MSSEERRAPGMTRIPFDGLVEVGGALGPSFEAQAVNVSEDGMLLRTAYLPEPGQPLTCRFDTGGGQGVLASGEVVWTEGAEKGGEFAIRFTDMDTDSVEALKRVCGVSPAGQPAAQAGNVEAGSKVRLHIEGLAAPMRAKIRDAGASAITVGSDLGFLQVGKPLELEDARSGTKRPACIDRVEVQIDPKSHVPQLVVTLRYGDAPAEAVAQDAARSALPSADRGGAHAVDDMAAVEEASAQMKGAVARNIARIGPAIERLAGRAKTTIALLAKRRAEKADDVAAPRRTTAPAPGGGLHTSGKRVIRGEASGSIDVPIPAPRLQMNKRNAAIGGAVMIAAILGAIAIKKTHHEAAPDATAVAAAGTAAPAFPATTAAQELPTTPPPSPFPPAFDPPVAGGAATSTTSLASGPVTADEDTGETSSHSEHHKHLKVTPFGNGSVHHGNMLHLKMDGPIESIEGAQQPTGFAVKVPGRKSLEAAGPLAARDSRIAAIKVSNDSAGAELTLAFKDGVPHYQVMAKGDTLIIALAPAGDLGDKTTVADKDDKGAKSKHHGAHGHKK